jgi:hypothetical protein
MDAAGTAQQVAAAVLDEQLAQDGTGEDHLRVCVWRHSGGECPGIEEARFVAEHPPAAAVRVPRPPGAAPNGSLR